MLFIKIRILSKTILNKYSAIEDSDSYWTMLGLSLSFSPDFFLQTPRIQTRISPNFFVPFCVPVFIRKKRRKHCLIRKNWQKYYWHSYFDAGIAWLHSAFCCGYSHAAHVKNDHRQPKGQPRSYCLQSEILHMSLQNSVERIHTFGMQCYLPC